MILTSYRHKAMTWNYRIIRHTDGHFALHEVFYDEQGNPNAVTKEPITFIADKEEGTDGIVKSLEMAAKDSKTRPVLDMSYFDELASKQAKA